MSPPPHAAVSSLILTLTADPDLRCQCLHALRQEPDLELGEIQRRWLPAVLENDASAERVRALERIPGVDFIEIVFVELPTAEAIEA